MVLWLNVCDKEHLASRNNFRVPYHHVRVYLKKRGHHIDNTMINKRENSPVFLFSFSFGPPYEMKKIHTHTANTNHCLLFSEFCNHAVHGLRTPREEKAFTARPKIHSHSQIFRYSQSIFCLPLRPNFSDIFDLCLHWVSVVCDAVCPRLNFSTHFRNIFQLESHNLSSFGWFKKIRTPPKTNVYHVRHTNII
jgi:hypothetical protein